MRSLEDLAVKMHARVISRVNISVSMCHGRHLFSRIVQKECKEVVYFCASNPSYLQTLLKENNMVTSPRFLSILCGSQMKILPMQPKKNNA